MNKGLVLFFCFFIALYSAAQEKELLLIGTMHTVPEIVKNSYEPLLDYAFEYKPEAIYVEYIHPHDTLSVNIYTPEFSEKADSLNRLHKLDEEYFSKLKNKRLADLSKKDFDFMSQAYLCKKDKANHEYYKYLSLYGISGAENPVGNENDDLTFKLAARMGVMRLFPIDDHQSDKEYYKAWDNAIRECKKNGDIEALNRLIDSNKIESMIAALLGRLGHYTNAPSSLDRYYLINSFRFANHTNAYTEAVQEFWEQRNQRMAENIVKHIMTHPYQRNILIVGAGHIVSLSKALKEICPDLKVIHLHEPAMN